MIEFLVYDRDGHIRSRGICENDLLEPHNLPGCTCIEYPGAGAISLPAWYTDGTVTSAPTAPSDQHWWDAEAREWVAPSAPTYAALRRDSYPTIADQLDALWHAMDIGELPKVAAFYEPIAAVKAAYPKE